MKNLVLVLIIFSINLLGSCLKIGINSGQMCTGNTIYMDNINKNFTQTMKVSDNNINVLDIPIYIFTNTNEKITMTISNVFYLKNFANEIINTTWHYIPTNGSRYAIIENQPFVLLAKNSQKRDGNSEVGFIRIKVKNLSDTQTVGIYKLLKNINIKLGNNLSLSSTLSCRGKVAQVSRIGFENLSAYKTGKVFKDSHIDYGNFRLYQKNEEKRNVFVKNNTNGALNIKFETSDLINKIDSKYRIAMKYYYRKKNGAEHLIINNTFFNIINGKNAGTVPVGEMRFVTEALDDTLVAGKYEATLYITISAN